ncbi:hypothetical protein GQ55_4G278200 [Panicum hallii var. hallii]|uniref:Uncharacterized protein n=1 Tax=Panicum hallii var. hallii TaxID=1504633 RepID=A0A2T7E0W3_9POAL|nr:hypothetical protein GQ55_4G278200 [Panicum hallii var. hallii]
MDSNNATAGAVPVAAPLARLPRRRRARGVQSTLAKASMLANFLPAGTLLAFEVALQAASVDGSCSAVSVATIRAPPRALRRLLLPLPLRLQLPDGKVYYGFASPRGEGPVAVQESGPGSESRCPGRTGTARLRRRRARGHVGARLRGRRARRLQGLRVPPPGTPKGDGRGDGKLSAHGGGRVERPLPGVPQHPLRHRLLGYLKTSRDHRPDQSMAV